MLNYTDLSPNEVICQVECCYDEWTCYCRKNHSWLHDFIYSLYSQLQ